MNEYMDILVPVGCLGMSFVIGLLYSIMRVASRASRAEEAEMQTPPAAEVKTSGVPYTWGVPTPRPTKREGEFVNAPNFHAPAEKK